MNSEHHGIDQRLYRSFLATARAAIAGGLAGHVPPDQLAAAVQQEIIALLCERAGRPLERERPASHAQHDDLLARLRELVLPFDFLGTAHLDYLSSTIEFESDAHGSVQQGSRSAEPGNLPAKPTIGQNVSRKSSGAYYTPQRVVRRIIDETLGRKLAATTTVEQAAELRVLDCACGSGAFLIEAARALHRFYTAHGMPEADAARIAAGQVFGVDVSPEAAEIARLAFRLASAEPCRGHVSEATIIAADSLRLTRAQWQESFPEAFAPRRGGFDVVVGNPPYRAATGLDAPTKRHLAKTFEAYAGHGDLHYCFFELGLDLLRPEGVLGLLSSAYFTQASHANKLRKLLAETSQIEKLIDCSDDALFPDASIHCLITILRKVHDRSTGVPPVADVWPCSTGVPPVADVWPCSTGVPPVANTGGVPVANTGGTPVLPRPVANTGGTPVLLRAVAPDAPPAGMVRVELAGEPPFDFPQEGLGEGPWVIISDSEKQWRARLERDAVPLGEFCTISQSPESGLNEAFVVSPLDAQKEELEPELLRLLIKNSDVGRYKIRYRDHLLIYIPRGIEIGRYPRILEHLAAFRGQLESREVCRNAAEPWHAFHRPRSAALMNAARKIVCPYRADSNKFAVDEMRALNDGGDLRMIFPAKGLALDLYFLTAVLNSRMMQRYFARVGRRKGQQFEYFKDSLKVLPIRVVPSDHPLHGAIADLSRLQHKTVAEQRDYLIERMVLDLYELKAAAVKMPGRLF